MTKHRQGECHRLYRRQMLKGMMASATMITTGSLVVLKSASATEIGRVEQRRSGDERRTVDACTIDVERGLPHQVQQYPNTTNTNCFQSTETHIRDGILNFASLSSIVIVCNLYKEGTSSGIRAGIFAKLGTDFEDAHEAVITNEQEFACFLPSQYHIRHRIEHLEYQIDGKILKFENGVLATRVVITAKSDSGAEKSTSRMMDFKSVPCLEIRDV